jgi:ribosome production factor 2
MSSASGTTAIALAMKRAKTKAGRRMLKERQSKVVENAKRAVILRGRKSNETVNEVLEELYLLKKPHGVKYTRKHDLSPFEDAEPLEHFSRKLDASLFVVGSHTKKRPNNLLMARTFDYSVYDMVEFEVVDFSALEAAKTTVGAKPLMVFQGDGFEHDVDLSHAKMMLMDFFRGEEMKNLALAAVDRALVFTAVNKRIFMCLYNVKFVSSGTPVPRVELEDSGLSMILSIRRNRLASTEMEREALKKPKQSIAFKEKNKEEGAAGKIMGRIHMVKQNLNDMVLRSRKMNALKKRSSDQGAESSERPSKRSKA